MSGLAFGLALLELKVCPVREARGWSGFRFSRAFFLIEDHVIECDQYMRSGGDAFLDDEAGFRGLCADMGVDFAFDEPGGFLAEFFEEPVEGVLVGLGLEHDGAVGFVADPAGDLVAHGDGAGAGAEPDALDSSLEDDALTRDHGCIVHGFGCGRGARGLHGPKWGVVPCQCGVGGGVGGFVRANLVDKSVMHRAAYDFVGTRANWGYRLGSGAGIQLQIGMD